MRSCVFRFVTLQNVHAKRSEIMSIQLRHGYFLGFAAALAFSPLVLLSPSVMGQTIRCGDSSISDNVQIGDGNKDAVCPYYEATRRMAVVHQPKSPVHVVTSNGDVVLRQTDRTDVQITAQLRARSEARLNAIKVAATREHDGNLSISVVWPEGKPQSDDRCSFEILVPDARGVRAETGNGKIVIDGLAGPIYASTGNGRIQVISVEGDVDVRSGNQDIELMGISGSVKAWTGNGKIQAIKVQGDVDVQSGNQGIEVTDAGGSVKAKTHNGPIQIILADDASGPLDVTTGNGSITLELGSAFTGQIELNAASGPINVDLPGAQIVSSDKRSKTLLVGNGKRKSTAQTANGGIRVLYRASEAKIDDKVLSKEPDK